MADKLHELVNLADPWFHAAFTHAAHRPYDYISRTGRAALELRHGRGGTRELYGGILKLALAVTRDPRLERAVLVLINSDLTPERLLDDWRAARRMFNPDISPRLNLVAVGRKSPPSIDPEDDFLRRLANSVQPLADAAGPNRESETDRNTALLSPKWRHVEVSKILLLRWLQRLGPLPIGKLAEDVGCTYTTAAKALARLEHRGVLTRRSNRAAEFNRFPHELWRELLAVNRSLRTSYWFGDTSGRPSPPQDLLRRLTRIQPEHVAFGGVAAGRHWDPQFDLNGLPRLDLVYHAPGNRHPNLDFVRRHLDPALKDVGPSAPSPSLVIHVLPRAKSFFAPGAEGELPLADPVETLLDLYDMRLDAQAAQLLTRLRPEVRYV